MGIFSIFCNTNVCCVFLFESPHRGDSNEYTQYTNVNIKRKNTLNYPKSAAMGLFQGTQEWVRNSRGKRAISVRANEVLLYVRLAWLLIQSRLTALLTSLIARR